MRSISSTCREFVKDIISGKHRRSGSIARYQPAVYQAKRPCSHLKAVCRAVDATASPIQNMGVDHRGTYVLMPQKLLDRPDIVPVLKQVCGKSPVWICPLPGQPL